MRPFNGKRVLLGVTGGIACYKSVFIARTLTQAGALVDVVLSRSASEFVGAITFEAVTGRPVYSQLVAAGHALDHIRIARASNVVVVAPATADFMARAAHGHADDLLTACLLATSAPVLIVPAMNDHMWAHPQTLRNAEHLRSHGYEVLNPDDGPLAVGEGSGPGRMPEPDTIVAYIGRRLERERLLRGVRVLVTAGPTREAVDPVRFLSNHSSGKMGTALAAAAWRRHAEVTLIHGPLTVSVPIGVRAIPVESTQQMANAVQSALANTDVLVMAAAPADFSPESVAGGKIKKADAPESLRLRLTPDILATTRDARRDGSVIVGFALETENAVQSGRAKLAAKALDLIVVNNAAEAGAGFSTDTNRVTLVHADGHDEELTLMSKSALADEILDRIVVIRASKGMDER